MVLPVHSAQMHSYLQCPTNDPERRFDLTQLVLSHLQRGHRFQSEGTHAQSVDKIEPTDDHKVVLTSKCVGGGDRVGIERVCYVGGVLHDNPTGSDNDFISWCRRSDCYVLVVLVLMHAPS